MLHRQSVVNFHFLFQCPMHCTYFILWFIYGVNVEDTFFTLEIAAIPNTHFCLYNNTQVEHNAGFVPV